MNFILLEMKDPLKLIMIWCANNFFFIIVPVNITPISPKHLITFPLAVDPAHAKVKIEA